MLSPLAGRPAPKELLVDPGQLERVYYARQPDPGDPDQLVSFGTSGHRGSPLAGSFTETHIAAIAQAICEYRRGQGTDGPLYMEKDTHTVSEPVQRRALEVLAANGVDTIIRGGVGGIGERGGMWREEPRASNERRDRTAARRRLTMSKDVHDNEGIAQALIADGKGILAADETVPTLTKRFDALGIQSTEQSRRTYREMLFTSAGGAEFISGVIMQDETIRQKSSGGVPLAQVLSTRGIVPGIKVDTGAKTLARSPGETVTEGLDGLRDRLAEYHGMGARFAKWRAVIRISDALPSPACVSANAHALARYAALCQEQHLVPIVEPEVLMEGSHSIERCEEVTAAVLHAVFQALFAQGVSLESMLLKPNMVIAGTDCPRAASVSEVATATLRCLRRHVPAAVPGIVFLSGGQSDRVATAHLNAINRLPGPRPWKVSFSYGRALQDSALLAWHGQDENLKAGQEALLHRARCNGAASRGAYTEDMEAHVAGAGIPAHRGQGEDDE